MEGHVQLCRHARHALCRHARHASQPDQVNCGEIPTFTFTFEFPGDKTRPDKTLVPWTVDGSLVFVATAYRLGRRAVGD